MRKKFIINDDGSVTFTGDRYKGVSGENLPYLVPFVEGILDIKIKTKPYFHEIKILFGCKDDRLCSSDS